MVMVAVMETMVVVVVVEEEGKVKRVKERILREKQARL